MKEIAEMILIIIKRKIPRLFVLLCDLSDRKASIDDDDDDDDNDDNDENNDNDDNGDGE